MRVGDFQSCTFNLENNLKLYLEDNGQLFALSFLHRFESQVNLIVGAEPLSLADTLYGLKFCQPDADLTIDNLGKIQPVFGFRRVQDQLYLR